MTWYELGPFTVFDFETTGLSAVTDRVVELAALRIDADGEESSFHRLVNPGRSIPPAVTNVHHIKLMKFLFRLCLPQKLLHVKI